jgi:hypothetical protein
MLEIDEVTLWMGEPYVINDKIKVLQPNMRQVLEFGERQYFSVVQTLCSTSSNMKSQLADMGLDWETIEDFQMFMMLAQSLDREKTKLVLGDIDLSKFKIVENKETGDPVMIDKENDIIIDQLIYMRIVEYLRKVHGLTRAYDRTKSKFVHDMSIEMDREEIANNAKKPYKSFLWPLISSVKAKQGYTKQYVLDMQVYELVHEANRLQVITQSVALLQGSYSGMVDTKKIKNFSEQCNWMRDIETNKHSGQELKEGTY